MQMFPQHLTWPLLVFKQEEPVLKKNLFSLWNDWNAIPSELSMLYYAHSSAHAHTVRTQHYNHAALVA